MFIVKVTHATGHGEESTPILLTEDIKAAVAAARAVEDLGYEILSYHNCVSIGWLDIGTVYRKPRHETKVPFGAPAEKYPWVFHRRPKYRDGKITHPLEWEEEWHDKSAKRMFEGMAGGIGLR